eukprot:TRINITY_DN1157_c0_g1_i4.p1 TRINITY_DN1157_c0_g1~~TRINITY_DN1157_c0_g1_i4.p1  ORF type:complete len:189 (-),score=32.55 TRINITY_DN1157_c0_g1_i4:198-701(-)
MASASSPVVKMCMYVLLVIAFLGSASGEDLFRDASTMKQVGFAHSRTRADADVEPWSEQFTRRAAEESANAITEAEKRSQLAAEGSRSRAANGPLFARVQDATQAFDVSELTKFVTERKDTSTIAMIAGSAFLVVLGIISVVLVIRRCKRDVEDDEELISEEESQGE